MKIASTALLSLMVSLSSAAVAKDRDSTVAALAADKPRDPTVGHDWALGPFTKLKDPILPMPPMAPRLQDFERGMRRTGSVPN